jgi:hypothetical protein
MALLGWQTKVSWSGVIILAWSVKVRQSKGVTIGDAMLTVGMVVSVGSIWYPELRATMVGAAAASVAAPVAAVAVSAYAIGGVIAFAAADPEDEGWYGVEALKEYYHDPVGTLVDIGEEHIVDPLVDWTQEQIIDPVAFWALRRVQELNQVKATFEREFFRNRWNNPFGLPF